MLSHFFFFLIIIGLWDIGLGGVGVWSRTLLYVDSLHVGFRSLEPQEREKKIGGWGNWGYVGIRGDTGGV